MLMVYIERSFGGKNFKKKLAVISHRNSASRASATDTDRNKNSANDPEQDERKDATDEANILEGGLIAAWKEASSPPAAVHAPPGAPACTPPTAYIRTCIRKYNAEAACQKCGVALAVEHSEAAMRALIDREARDDR